MPGITGKWEWYEFVMREWEPTTVPAGLRLGTGCLLACYMVINYGRGGREIFPSAKNLGRRFDIAESTVKRYRQWFINEGIFEITSKRGRVPVLAISYPDTAPAELPIDRSRVDSELALVSATASIDRSRVDVSTAHESLTRRNEHYIVKHDVDKSDRPMSGRSEKTASLDNENSSAAVSHSSAAGNRAVRPVHPGRSCPCQPCRIHVYHLDTLSKSTNCGLCYPQTDNGDDAMIADDADCITSDLDDCLACSGAWPDSSHTCKVDTS